MTAISYAQNFEDVMLWRALGHVRNGFYVDVGAQRADVDSVTRLFYERGWRGINIEPVEQWHQELVAKRPRDVNLKVAAGRAEGEITLNVFGDTGLSTAVDTYASEHDQSGFARQVERVPVRTLKSICEEFHVAPIHFLKIDVEGFEADVLAGADFNLIRPWIVVVEATLPNSRVTNFEAWEPLLLDARYKFVYFDGLNRFYVAEERRELQENFLAPPNVFDDFTLSGTASNPFSTFLVEQLLALEASSGELASDLSRANAQVVSTQAEATQAATELAALRTRFAELSDASEQLKARNADFDYELSIARKRLAADTRSLIVRDERIQALEQKLENLGDGWQRALDDAIVRLGDAVQAQVTRLANLAEARSHDEALHLKGLERLEAAIEAGGKEQSSLAQGMARLEHAIEARIADADQRVDGAGKQIQVLSAELSSARAELTASLGTAHHWYQAHENVSAALEATQKRLSDVLDSNHAWFIRAGELERAVTRIEASRSWRLTAPVRALRRITVAVAKATIKPPLFLAIRLVRGNPALWAVASRRLKAHPRLFSRLKSSALAAGVVPAPVAVPTQPSTRPLAAQSSGDADLSAHQRRILQRIRPGA